MHHLGHTLQQVKEAVDNPILCPDTWWPRIKTLRKPWPLSLCHFSLLHHLGRTLQQVKQAVDNPSLCPDMWWARIKTLGKPCPLSPLSFFMSFQWGFKVRIVAWPHQNKDIQHRLFWRLSGHYDMTLRRHEAQAAVEGKCVQQMLL